MADPGPVARAIVAGMQVSGLFRHPPGLYEAEAREALADGTLAFVVTIPTDFHARSRARAATPQIVIEADATDPAASANAVAAMPEIVRRAVAVSAVRAAGARRQPSAAAPRSSSTGSTIRRAITAYNIVPGLIGTILTMTTTLMTALALTREIERGTMENLLAMPVRPVEIMVGKIVPYIGLGFLQVAVILAAAFAALLRADGGLADAAPLRRVLLFIAANVTLGYTFSTLARTQMQAMQMTFFFFLPSILLSGFMFPFRGMPRLGAGDRRGAAAHAFPARRARHHAEGQRRVASAAASVAGRGCSCSSSAALALLRFRRTLD